MVFKHCIFLLVKGQFLEQNLTSGTCWKFTLRKWNWIPSLDPCMRSVLPCGCQEMLRFPHSDHGWIKFQEIEWQPSNMVIDDVSLTLVSVTFRRSNGGSSRLLQVKIVRRIRKESVILFSCIWPPSGSSLLPGDHDKAIHRSSYREAINVGLISCQDGHNHGMKYSAIVIPEWPLETPLK